MANPARGEYEFVVGDTSYTLVLGSNALCEVEAHLKTRLGEVVKVLESGSPSIEYIRALLWGALRKHHRGFSIEQVGDIIDRAGMARVGEAIGETMRLAFPDAEAKADNANPQKAE
jgi:hypothetical protein